MTNVDMDQIRKDYEESKEESARTGEFWSPKVGPNLIRIMPPWKDGVGVFYMKTYHHWRLEEGPICCQRRMFGQRCYICEKVKELRATKNSTDAQKAKAIGAKKDVYFNVIDLNDKDRGIQIWRCGGGVFTQIMAYAADEADYPDITDPDKGFDFKIERTGTGLDTEYLVRARRKPTPIENKKWLEELIDLDQFSIIEDYDQQLASYGYKFGEGSPPKDREEAEPAIEDDEFDNKIEKDPGAQEVSTIKAAWCEQMNNFGNYNEDMQECRKCTIRDNCASGTRAKKEAATEGSQEGKAKELTKKMKEEAKKK